MPGKGISKLGRPRKRYSSVGQAKFYRKRAKRREDGKRARLLRQTARKYDLSDTAFAAALRALADRIDPKTTRKPKTLASARYKRRHRLRVTGELWRLYEEGNRQPRTFMLLPQDHIFEPDHPDGLHPLRVPSQLRIRGPPPAEPKVTRSQPQAVFTENRDETEK